MTKSIVIYQTEHNHKSFEIITHQFKFIKSLTNLPK